ncbi:hypothetical protein OHC33_002160 [Knufia fluminis]|uniref:Apple domain-containing protein n=1 Tax=Knufia fluminis TaxID=191047 RepID=A0AAN8I7Z7_9EURO|nr:hypothetical protein OHC33_002160 [Knufia fluminis]
MLLTNLVLVSLLGLSSASSLELRKDDQCRIVTETHTGAAFWVPTPEAARVQVPSASGRPGTVGPATGKPELVGPGNGKPETPFSEILGKPASGPTGATSSRPRPTSNYNNNNNLAHPSQHSHFNSVGPSNGIGSHGSHPQESARSTSTPSSRQTGTGSHEWEDWALAGTPFPRPSFVGTKGSISSKPSNHTTTSTGSRTTSATATGGNGTYTHSNTYGTGNLARTTSSNYGYITSTTMSVGEMTTSDISSSARETTTVYTTFSLTTSSGDWNASTPTTTSGSIYSNSTSSTITTAGNSTIPHNSTASTTTEVSSTMTSAFTSTTTTLSVDFSNHTTTLFGNHSTTTTSSASTTTSSSAYGPGTEFELQGPIDLGSVPPTILDAVSPPDIDMGSLDRLDAQEKSNLWFNGPEAGGDEENGGVTVRVSVEYKYPSIVLDQSIYIKDLTCTSDGISGRFNQPLAYERAKTAWEDHPLIFITTSPSCVKDGEASFFLVSSAVTFEDSDQTFIISGTVSELADIFEDMAIDFGKIDYEVPTAPSSPSDEDPATNTCGSPDSDTINGLPAVACGSGFDKALNDKLGYYSDDGDDQYVFSVAAPSAISTPSPDRRDDSFTYMSERSVMLEKRCWIFCAVVNAVKAVVKAVVNVVVAVVQAVVIVVKEVVKRAEEVFLPIIKKVVDIGISIVKQAVKIVVFIATGKYDQSLSLGLNMVPPATMLEDSPWGDALKFYSWSPDAGGEAWEASAYALDQIQGTLMGLEAEPEPGVEFYCINCGISGKMTAVGSIQATPLSGVKSAQIGVHGNLYAGLYLGVNAFAKYEKKYEKELFSRGLPGWSIPGIVNLGPMLTLGVEAGITIEAEGQLLTGASLSWPAFEATLDFIDDKQSSQSGWTPNIDHKFQVAGTLSAEASLGLPVSVEFGIDLLNKKFKRTVALTDTPALAAEAELSVSYDAEEGIVIGDEEGECPGIAWSIGLKNEVSLEFKDENDEGPEFSLFEWTSPPLAEGCIALGEGGGSGGDEGSEEGDESGGGEGDNGGETGSGDNEDDGGIPTLPGGDEDDTDPGDLACPNWNDKQFTDSSGNQWNIRCNAPQLLVGDQGITGEIQHDSMATCINSCSNHPSMERCIGVLWNSDNSICYWVGTKTNSYTTTPPTGPIALAEPITPYVIHAVMFANFDITNEARTWFNKGHKLYVYTNGFSSIFGDPQPGVQKSFSMLYQYGPEMRVLTALEGENINIIPGPIRRTDLERISPDPYLYQTPETASYVRIYDVAYGHRNIPFENTWGAFQNIYYAINYLGSVQFTNSLFTYDTRVGTVKTGAIFVEKLQTDPGRIVPIHAWENEWVAANGFGRPWKRSVNTLDARQDDGAEISDDDFTTFTVEDTTGSLALQIGTDGNLFLSNLEANVDITDLTTGSSFVGLSDPHTLIVGDTAENLLHYFPNEISHTGASRLRLAPWDKLPRTSRLVNLLQVEDPDSGKSMLVAADSMGEHAFLWFCGIEGGLGRVFLVKDALGATGVLEGEGMEFVVSGGKAGDCGPLALVGKS